MKKYIPHFLTSLNLTCGCIAILLLSKDNYNSTVIFCLFAFLFTILPMMVYEEPTISNILKDSYEILYVGILSSGLAFLLQTYTLQNLTPAPAAIIFSLEGMFAAIFAWLILDQFLNEIKILGIFLILFAVMLSQIIPIYDKKKYERN